jgi:hypothetical protein
MRPLSSTLLGSITMPKKTPLPSQALKHIPDHVLDKHPEFADRLAVAFTDQNNNHTYEPGTDLLIASLLDANNDGVVSVGDRIHFGTYPTTFDGSGPRGSFTGPDVFVTGIDTIDGQQIAVITPLGNVNWFHDPLFGDRFTSSGSLTAAANLIDAVGPFFDIDQIIADPNGQGPGEPDTFVQIIEAQPSDRGFIDVLFV